MFFSGQHKAARERIMKLENLGADVLQGFEKRIINSEKRIEKLDHIIKNNVTIYDSMRFKDD